MKMNDERATIASVIRKARTYSVRTMHSSWTPKLLHTAALSFKCLIVVDSRLCSSYELRLKQSRMWCEFISHRLIDRPEITQSFRNIGYY